MLAPGRFRKKKLSRGSPVFYYFSIFFCLRKVVEPWYGENDWSLVMTDQCLHYPAGSPDSPDSPLSLLTARHERERDQSCFIFNVSCLGVGERYISYFSPHFPRIIQIPSSVFCSANCQTNQPASSVGRYRNSVTWLFTSQRQHNSKQISLYLI